jgi:hypothetical protein
MDSISNVDIALKMLTMKQSAVMLVEKVSLIKLNIKPK